jgi:FkbM family methyltransferase
MYKLFQNLPPFRGKLRLANLLLNKNKLSLNFTIPIGLKFTVPNFMENVSFELLVNGHYEKNILDLIVSKVPPNGVFVDVGANIGAICVVLAKIRPDITIYAFEASSKVFEYLNLNKIQNGLQNLHVYNLAIHTSDNEKLEFFSPDLLNGKGSFSPVFTDKSELVNTISLDSFFKKNSINPSFIKIDVEGYEALIVESMTQYCSTENPCPILFEFIDWTERLANFEVGTAQEMLLKFNYKLFDVAENRFITKPKLKGDTMILATK